MAMTKKLMFVAAVLLLGVLGFALDAGITAAILFHSTERTITARGSTAKRLQVDTIENKEHSERVILTLLRTFMSDIIT